MRAAGLPGDGPVLVHFHGYVTRDSDGPVEVAVPFTGSVEPIDDLRVRISPAGTDAFLPVARADADFPGILRVYDALGGLDRRAPAGLHRQPGRDLAMNQ